MLIIYSGSGTGLSGKPGSTRSKGLYEYLVTPFELTDATAVLRAMINYTL